MMRDGVSEFKRPERTQPLGNVPETEPRPTLETLSFALEEALEAEPQPEVAKGDDRAARLEAAYRELRYRAHRYHGVTRVKPPVSQHSIDAAASFLARAAVRFTHALGAVPKLDQHDANAPCVCIYCV